jgi:tripartite-type tricarboxylate transporter receptor subunit TctC
MVLSAVLTGCQGSTATPTAAPAPKATAPAAPATTTTASAAAPTKPATTSAATTTTAASTSAAATLDSANLEFYKGKTVTLYTSGTAGSGSDLWARTIAKYLPDVIGAKVVVQNESAGNGKVIFNQFQTPQIKADGLSILYTPVGTLWPGYMTGDTAAQYDITKFTYIGGVESGNYVVAVAPNGKIKTVDDLKAAKGLKFAHSAKVSTITMANALVIDLMGLDGKIILGFDGATGRQLAVQQGDADATVMAADTALIAKQKNQINLLMQVGVTKTDPQDLSLLMDLVKKDSLTDNQKRLVGTYDVLADSKSVFAPPGLPQDKANFLTAAFKKVYDTKAFQDDIVKTTASPLGPYVAGKDLQKRAADLAAKKGDMKLWDELLNKYVK